MRESAQMSQSSSSEEMDQHTFLIPAPNVERFRKKLNSLARRAKKLGMAGFSSVDLGEHVEWKTFHKSNGKKEVLRYVYRKIMVTGERPKMQGWTLLGTIAHEKEGTVFSNAPGKEIPESYRNASNQCDHCGTRRRRRDTMIIEKDGQVRQIGRNCLQDFIGDVNVKGITMYYETWPSLETFVGAMNTGVSRDYVNAIDYLSAVACSIRNFGFVSSTAAMADHKVIPTKQMAWEILYPNTKNEDPLPVINTQDRDDAADILSWAKEELGKRNLTGYLANLHSVLASGWIRHKHSGLAASAFRARENDIIGQQKAEERRKAFEERRARWAEERAQEKNEHFGDVKERTHWVLRVIKVTEKDGDFGSYFSILFKDPEGRMCLATTTKEEIADLLEKEKTYLVQGTVKKHETWNDERGTKCTYLNRIKVKGEAVESNSKE